ncbi:hypothetical protein WA026_002672 [Henosepilachna vigintioctopunctata]|uniref:Uncharacterized protein n=1 Tax=Henosepilachna vigintioctopunctata TaxID=420089 RepID=A0AAW1U311_9CUCU
MYVLQYEIGDTPFHFFTVVQRICRVRNSRNLLQFDCLKFDSILTTPVYHMVGSTDIFLGRLIFSSDRNSLIFSTV